MDNKPEKLILDYSKWRCGGDGPNKLGTGIIALLNGDGFSCCLGQWSMQQGASEDELLDYGEPQEIKTLIPVFNKQAYPANNFDSGRRNTIMATQAIGINDDEETTPEEKINALRELLAEEGIELEVINKP